MLAIFRDLFMFLKTILIALCQINSLENPISNLVFIEFAPYKGKMIFFQILGL